MAIGALGRAGATMTGPALLWANTPTRGQIAGYTYGVDRTGKGYVYDKYEEKMLFYGAPNQAIKMGQNLHGQFEGDFRPSGTGTSGGGGGWGISSGGGGGSTYAPLDQAQIDSLQALLTSYDIDRAKAKTKAGRTRDTRRAEKDREKEKERGKYESKTLTSKQDFGQALADTDINTRDTLENLLSSLAVMGMGGGRALTRQILGAANKANRQANVKQAQELKDLDSAWNEYQAGYQDDIEKIQDQYQHDIGEADRDWGQKRQNALNRMADVYGSAGRQGDRNRLMGEARNLSSFISNASFVNPQYSGKRREMATPELADYTQNIAMYDTTNAAPDALTPVGADETTKSGNLAMRAVKRNRKDLGVKKRTEGELGYGV